VLPTLYIFYFLLKPTTICTICPPIYMMLLFVLDLLIVEIFRIKNVLIF
jgi:hypothetical protein